MLLQASTQVNRTQGSLRGGVPSPQRGVWGEPPPDPGSAHTKKIRPPQILIIVPIRLHQRKIESLAKYLLDRDQNRSMSITTSYCIVLNNFDRLAQISCT
jgi:hypothetical protein